MQVLMSDTLKGKIDFGIEETTLDKKSLMACFVFKDEQMFEKFIQVSFKKTKQISKNLMANIVLQIDEDLSLVKKLLSGAKLEKIEIPAFEYCYQIDGSISYLLEETHNYGYTLNIIME